MCGAQPYMGYFGAQYKDHVQSRVPILVQRASRDLGICLGSSGESDYPIFIPHLTHC
jgi:hypothetical protein